MEGGRGMTGSAVSKKFLAFRQYNTSQRTHIDTHALTHSLTHSTHSRTHSLTNSLTHFLFHNALTHSQTHLLTRFYNQAPTLAVSTQFLSTRRILRHTILSKMYWTTSHQPFTTSSCTLEAMSCSCAVGKTTRFVC